MAKAQPTPEKPDQEPLLDRDWLQRAKISWPVFVAVITIGGGFLWKIAQDYTAVLKDIEYTKEQLRDLETAVESLQKESIKTLHDLDKRVEKLEESRKKEE